MAAKVMSRDCSLASDLALWSTIHTNFPKLFCFSDFAGFYRFRHELYVYRVIINDCVVLLTSCEEVCITMEFVCHLPRQ